MHECAVTSVHVTSRMNDSCCSSCSSCPFSASMGLNGSSGSVTTVAKYNTVPVSFFSEYGTKGDLDIVLGTLVASSRVHASFTSRHNASRASVTFTSSTSSEYTATRCRGAPPVQCVTLLTYIYVITQFIVTHLEHPLAARRLCTSTARRTVPNRPAHGYSSLWSVYTPHSHPYHCLPGHSPPCGC